MTSIGLRWRIPGALLDFLPFLALYIGLGWLEALPGPFWRIPEDWYWTEWWLHVALESPWNYAPSIVVLVCFLLAGHALACWGYGASRLLGIRVRSEESVLTATRIAMRLFGIVLNILSLGLGYLWIFAHPRRLGWHDLISRSFPTRD